MAHSTNIISSIKLPDNNVYEIHDAQAIHSAEELGISAALVFKGTKAAVSNLPTTGNKVGDVWHVTADDCEYVWTDGSAWEALGSLHDAASSTHTHTVAVTGTNSTSAVTGSVTVPTVSATQKYLTASNAAPDVSTDTDSVLGANTTFTVTGGNATTKKIKATVGNVVVAGNGIANAITGFGVHSTTAAITSLNTTTIKNPTVTNGTAASWNASVDSGVLSFSWTANAPTAVSTSDVTVATGAKDTADAITGLGTPTTAKALTSVQVATQPTVTLSVGTTGDVDVVTGVSDISVTASGDNVTALTGVEVGAPKITLTNNAASATGSVPVVSGVTIGSTFASLTDGVAAAQAWTQSDGSTGAPVTSDN